MRTGSLKVLLLALAAVGVVSMLSGFSPSLYAENDKFQIRADGSVLAGPHRFASLAEYFRSAYFKETGKRCGTDRKRLERAGHARRSALPSDCSLDSTTIRDQYRPLADYVIPVVFHVIYKADGTGNISDQRIDDQLIALNEDFGAWAGTMGSRGFNSRIQFTLAGVTRTQNDSWHDDEDELAYKTALGWDQDEYLNVYVNSASGYLGYAYLPQDLDDAAKVYLGVVMLYETIGGRNNGFDIYDQGRTLVHEIGHHLGLLHTFEGFGCYNGYRAGDLIADTNSERLDHYECLPTTTCATLDPIRNYMNYTPDSCMREFTPEQANRMVCTLVNYLPGSFSTVPVFINVSAPAGAPAWQKGKVYAIAWLKSGPLNASVSIRLYQGGGKLVRTIVSKTANDGSFAWRVPAGLPRGSNYSIRVQTVDNRVKGDSGYFSIVNPIY